jgi:hypothetical protein
MGLFSSKGKEGIAGGAIFSVNSAWYLKKFFPHELNESMKEWDWKVHVKDKAKLVYINNKTGSSINISYAKKGRWQCDIYDKTTSNIDRKTLKNASESVVHLRKLMFKYK